MTPFRGGELPQVKIVDVAGKLVCLDERLPISVSAGQAAATKGQ